VRDIGMGCCVLQVEPEPGDDQLEPTVMPIWKSFHSLNLMLPKEDRTAMLLRIFNDTTPLINNGLQKKQRTKPDEDKGEDAKMEEAPDQEHSAAEAGIEDNAKLKETGTDLDEEDLYAAEDALSE